MAWKLVIACLCYYQIVSIFFLASFSSNILIDKHKEAKIGDFGLAMFATNGTDTGILTHVSTNMSSKLFSTVAYMPPEFVRSSGKHYLAGDVYSFGVVSIILVGPLTCFNCVCLCLSACVPPHISSN